MVLGKFSNFSNGMVKTIFFFLAVLVCKKKPIILLMTQYSPTYICTGNEPWGIHGENHGAHLQQLIHNWFVHAEEGLRLFLFFLCVFPLKSGNWKKIDAWHPKAKEGRSPSVACWGFWVCTFDCKCKATFGRLDSTPKCAKSLPMEKELNAKSLIQVWELYGISQHSTVKANTPDQRKNLRSDVPS